MIEFLNINKKFRNNFWEKEFLALSDVSFNLQEGDLVGFLGANGAGKTTLIKILMDFSRQSSGQVIFGKSISKKGKLDKSRIGYLPERSYLYPHLTGQEFLTFAARLNELPPSVYREEIKKWTKILQIDHALDRQIKGYSKGMQQRLGFISVLLHNPQFILLDEPLSGLDPIGRREFKMILKEIHQLGKTVFFSSHVVSDVEEICSKVVFLEKGKLIYNGPIDTLIKENDSHSFTLTYLLEGQLKVDLLSEDSKNFKIKNLIDNGASLISLEKNQANLEEIIYKIKK